MRLLPASLRVALLPSLLASLALAGCKDNLEMVTAAWDSASVSEGSTAGLTEATEVLLEVRVEPVTGNSQRKR